MRPSGFHLRGWRRILRHEVRREGLAATVASLCCTLLLVMGLLAHSSGAGVLAKLLLGLALLILWYAVVQTRHWHRLRAMERNS